MPIKYKIVDKAKPGIKKSIQTDPIPTPVAVFSDTIDYKNFINKFRDQSRISMPEIYRFLMALRIFLIEELKEGNIVQTGIIGTFYPSVKKAKGTLTKDAMEIGINYRPDKIMKEELKKADLKRVR